MEFPGGRVFEASIADLLAEPSDCIVNAANGDLSLGGGVAAQISDAAGPDLDEECYQIVRQRGRIPIGEAVVTTAGELPFKGVIHAVGPRLGDGQEEQKLVETMLSAFLRAHERGWRSLSFPAVSSGLFHVPEAVCARAYVTAVREFFEKYPHSTLKTIRLTLYKGPLVDAVRAEFERVRKLLLWNAWKNDGSRFVWTLPSQRSSKPGSFKTGGSTMEVTIKDLRQRYEAMQDEELVALQLTSELTETASSVLSEVLSARGITPERLEGFAAGKEEVDVQAQFFQLDAYSGESVHLFRGKASTCSEDIRPRVPKETVRVVGA
jgi:O-acetyl-ADP-ribose deacetylase